MKISKKILCVVVLATTALSTSAFAVLPASVGTSITGIQTDGQTIFDLVFPVVAVFVGLGIVIALFKRFTSKI
jgi:NADH:ubiquinone oxidoreductase subunit K